LLPPDSEGCGLIRNRLRACLRAWAALGISMTKELPERELLGKLQDILVEEFEMDRDAIVPEANLYEDLNIDSIDAVDLIVRLRELTGKKIPPEQFKSVRTVGDVVRIIESL
jgi:acyl carrier protein